MWELEYKAECQNWCFWTVVLEKTLESPLDYKKSNQSILKEISLEYTLEGLMLKLKLQYFGHLIQRTDYLKRPWCWERLKAGGDGDDRGWDGWMASRTLWIWVWVSSGNWQWKGCAGWTAWRAAVLGVTKSQTWLSDWTELIEGPYSKANG